MHEHVFSSGLFAAVLATVFATAACGGNTPDPAAPGVNLEKGTEHAGHGDDAHGEKGEHAEHHGKLPPPVHEFHEVLGPLWHMEKGADRTAKTCAQATMLRDKATATGDKDLVAATTSLVAECEKEGKPEFDARFTVVHERFHALAEK